MCVIAVQLSLCNWLGTMMLYDITCIFGDEGGMTTVYGSVASTWKAKRSGLYT